MPTLTQLEYIIAVDKYRHFGQAAKSCNISQPTLSMQIQKVEDELSLVIFDRIKKPIVPTSRGLLFIQQAKKLIQEHEKLLQISQNEGKEIRGSFRLAVIPTIAPYLLPLFIEEFSRKYPKVDLRIDELKTSSVIDGLKNGTIDGGIAATPLHENTLKERPLFYEPFDLYVAKNNPLSKKTEIRHSDLVREDMWLLQDGHCFRNQVVEFCGLDGDSGIFKNVHFEGGSLETLRYLVRKSRGYTLVPKLFSLELSASERKEYVRTFQNPVPTREVSLVFKTDQWRQNILEAIEQMIISSVPKNLVTYNAKKQVILDGQNK